MTCSKSQTSDADTPQVHTEAVVATFERSLCRIQSSSASPRAHLYAALLHVDSGEYPAGPASPVAYERIAMDANAEATFSVNEPHDPVPQR